MNITTDELELFAKENFTIDDKAKSNYHGIVKIIDFTEKIIIPTLKTQVGLTNSEKIILDVFVRMYLCMKSLEKLDNRGYYQQISSIARSIYELYLDFKILNEDNTGEAFDKYKAFAKVEKYRCASNMVKFASNNQRYKKEYKRQKAFLKIPCNSDKTIENLKLKFWPNRKLQASKKVVHWTGLNCMQRANELDKTLGTQEKIYEKMYIDIYIYFSWMIHSGPLGSCNLPYDTVICICGYSHVIAQKLFIEAIKLIGQKFHLDKIDNLENSFSQVIEDLKLYPGIWQLEEFVTKQREGK